MIKYTLISFCLFFLIGRASSQEGFTLQKVIEIAQTQSPQFKMQETQKLLSYYNYLIFKSDLKPQVSLYGNLPGYSKQYSSIVQPDGNIIYLPIKQNISEAGFSLSQQISATGGLISLNTDLSRFDDLYSKTHQYNGTPLFIQLNQPLFGAHPQKWDRKIEPLKLEEAKRAFIQSMESISQDEVRLYFNVVDAQENIRVAEINIHNTRENYEIEKKRISLGTTTEDRILQLQLQQLTCEQNLEKSRYNYQIASLGLKASLGMNDSTNIVVVVPDDIPTFQVDLNDALAFARNNRPEFIGFERKRLESQKLVDNAKAAKQQINLTATYGLNRASSELGVIYSSPKDQQTFSIGFNVPIMDWGRRNAAYNAAKANQKLVAYNNEIDEINYNQEIVTLVKNIVLLRQNIKLTNKRDSVAQRRYVLANQLYQIGKLSITDLNIAQNEKDNSRQEYIFALRAFWDSYYLLRRITLYDFENKRQLIKPEFENLPY